MVSMHIMARPNVRKGVSSNLGKIEERREDTNVWKTLFGNGCGKVDEKFR